MAKLGVTSDQLNQLDAGKPGSSVQRCPLQDKGGVYRVNRQLAAVQNVVGRSTPAPLLNAQVLSHTFVYTTDENGDLLHTYSWGNEYSTSNPSHWYKDRPEDVAAATEAIGNGDSGGLFGYGSKVGGSDLIPHVDQAYNALRQEGSPSAHANWWVANNCKSEADRLIDTAQALARPPGR